MKTLVFCRQCYLIFSFLFFLEILYLYFCPTSIYLLLNNLIYRVFFVLVFDRASCLHFSFDFVHWYLIFFGRWCAVEWGMDRNCIISVCRVVAYCSTHSTDGIVICTSFDGVLSFEESEVSVNRIGWEINAGDSIEHQHK